MRYGKYEKFSLRAAVSVTVFVCVCVRVCVCVLLLYFIEIDILGCECICASILLLLYLVASSPHLPLPLSRTLLPLLPLCVLLRAPFFWHLIRFACNGKINIENGKWELQTKAAEEEELEEEDTSSFEFYWI